MTLKKELKKNEYLQLEGLYVLYQDAAKRMTECESAAAEILCKGEVKDAYDDGAWLFSDNVWDGTTLVSVLNTQKIKIKKKND